MNLHGEAAATLEQRPRSRPPTARGVDVEAEQVTVRRVGLAVVVAAALLTSACAAGQYAQSATNQETIDGTSAKIGMMTLGGLAIQTPQNGVSYPAGSDVPLKIVVVNSGQRTDTLTSITSSSITGWGAYSSAAAAAAAQATTSSSVPVSSTVPSSTAGSSSVAPGGGSTSVAPSDTGSPSTPPATTSAPSLPAPKTSISVGGHSRASFGTPDVKGELLLRGIKSALHPGMAIELTFTFQQAGTVSVQVPVQLSKSPQTSIIPGPSATGQEG
jgi:hypothetical protein